MTNGKKPTDLIAIVPDGDMEATVRALLSRSADLGIRPITFDVRRHVQRDAGCRSDCHNYLRLWLRDCRYAMVLFDHEGSGRQQTMRAALEAEVEATLNANGWRDRCAVVVIAPELEAWVWSGSPVVDEIMGWYGRDPSVRKWLQSETSYWTAGRAKPEQPKEAVEAALRKARQQRSPSLYEDLAGRVPIERCTDPSFGKFRAVLRRWFPLQPGR
jgi:hypothetical protein